MTMVAILVLLCATTATAQTSSDEFTKMVADYELTMPRIEAYGAVMAGITEWAEANPKARAAMMARAPKGPATVEVSAAVFDTDPAVKALLEQHKITGRDLILIPTAVMQAQMVALGESQGHTFPASGFNPKNVALAKANGAAIDAVMKKATADRARAFPR